MATSKRALYVLGQKAGSRPDRSWNEYAKVVTGMLEKR